MLIPVKVSWFCTCCRNSVIYKPKDHLEPSSTNSCTLVVAVFFLNRTPVFKVLWLTHFAVVMHLIFVWLICVLKQIWTGMGYPEVSCSFHKFSGKYWCSLILSAQTLLPRFLNHHSWPSHHVLLTAPSPQQVTQHSDINKPSERQG